MVSKTRLTPVDPNQRLLHVDMVRGFALFGVMLVNMFNFGANSIIWVEPVDEAAFSVMRFFFETKSWRLFSFLFGFGFALQFLRARQRQANFLPTYVWRLTLLFMFGMANALLYRGDILMYYAELGLVLILFWKVPARYLIMLVVGLLLVFPMQRTAQSLLDGPWPPQDPFEIRLERDLEETANELATHPYSVGTIGEVMAENAQVIPPNLFLDLEGAEAVFGFFAMFLLGLYVGKRRILHEPKAHDGLIRRICNWGIGLGILSMSLERLWHYSLGYELFEDYLISPLLQFVGDFVFSFGATALALGYAAGIVLLARSAQWCRLVMPLAAVGRMALSIYLLQTLMFSTLFYGYALGQVGKTGPAMVIFYAVVFFAVQIVIANWWLGRFRFGPAEWLWRSLTYFQSQPMRKL
jgi:uncharacterized protein